MGTLTANDPSLMGIEGIDYFSSLGKSEMTHTLRRMGYMEYITCICDISDNGGKMIADALLGIEGQVFDESVIQTMSIPPSIFPLRHQGDQSIENSLVFRKTPIYLSRAFGVNESVLNFSGEQYGNDPLGYDDALLSEMTGKPVSTYKPIPCQINTENTIEKSLGGGRIAYIQQNPDQSGRLTFLFSGQGEGYPIYLDFLNYFMSFGTDTKDYQLFLGEKYLMYIEQGDNRHVIRSIEYISPHTNFCIGDYAKDEPVKVIIEYTGVNLVIESLNVYCQSVNEVYKSIEPLLKNQAKFEWTGSSSARILTQNDSGDILFVSMPYDTGWTATMDGEAAEVIDVAEGFIGLRMPEGAHEYRLQFFPNGLKEGIGITVVSFVLALVWLYVLYRKRIAVSTKNMHE
jgi:uncharacterized membrane protein YfhO